MGTNVPHPHQTDAEAAHDVPGAPASDDGDLDDACPTLVGWAGVDGDVLAQLIPMLERHVRSAASVDLIGEARAVSEHGGTGAAGGAARKRGGNKKQKKMGGTSSSGEDDDDDEDNDGVGVLGQVANATGAGRKAATVSEVSLVLVVVVADILCDCDCCMMTCGGGCSMLMNVISCSIAQQVRYTLVHESICALL